MCNNAAFSASTEMGQGLFRNVNLVCKCTSLKRHGGGMSFLQPLCEPPLQLGGSPPGS